MLYPITKNTNPTLYEPDSLYRESQHNDLIMNAFEEDIFIKGTILEDWSKASVDSESSRNLLSVGEFKTHEFH